jgi:rhamnose transport system permease protein
VTRLSRIVAPLARWEAVLVVLIVAAGIWSSTLSSVFLTRANLLDVATPYIYLGLLAFGLMFVVLAGEIDISAASTMAVGGVVFGQVAHAGANPWVAALAALAVATALGLINGVFVAILGLPSLAITLGTLAAYRGLAFVILGDRSLSNFPHGVVSNIGGGYLWTELPVPLLVFVVCAVALGFLLHWTRFGRYLYTVGANRDAARFSGVPERRTRLCVFGISGFMAGLAALVYVGYFDSVQADAASGSELLYVITVVVIGGVSIFGGSGTILGVILAFVLIAVVRNGMQLANVGGSTPDIVIGALLLVAIMAGNALQAIEPKAARARRHADELPDRRVTQGDEESPLAKSGEVQPMNEVGVHAKQE